jgi:hypothetical protein
LRKGRTLQKISTGVSLISLCLGFWIVGMLIIVNRHRADLNGLSGESSVATAGGIGAILVGMAFLVAACLHWNFWTGCSGPRDAEESVPRYLNSKISTLEGIALDRFRALGKQVMQYQRAGRSAIPGAWTRPTSK